MVIQGINFAPTQNTSSSSTQTNTSGGGSNGQSNSPRDPFLDAYDYAVYDDKVIEDYQKHTGVIYYS